MSSNSRKLTIKQTFHKHDKAKIQFRVGSLTRSRNRAVVTWHTVLRREQAGTSLLRGFNKLAAAR